MADSQDQPVIRILIVEDEVIIGSDLKARLENLGYLVCGQVQTGQAAVDAAAREKPDLVFMDIILKGPMDGIDAADIIRSRFDIPIIFVTAWADEARLARAKMTRPFGYLLKPFQDRDIKVTVEMAMYVSQVDRERRQVEETLREREAKLSSILRAAPIGIGIFADRVLVEANETLCRMLGYQREELVRLSARMLYPEQADYDFVGREMYGQVETLGAGSVETRWQRKNGEIIQVGLKATPMDPEEPSRGVTFAVMDITEQKQADQALRESLERFRLTFNTSPDSININRLKGGVYVDVNDGFTRLTGFTREDAIGRTSLELNAWHDPADYQRLVDDLNSKGLCENLETQIQRKDGSLVTTLMSSRIITLGGVPHVISITRDISDWKTAQRALWESEQRFRQLVENAPLGILAMDREGRIQDINYKLSEILGSPSREETRLINLLTFAPLVKAGIAGHIRECLDSGRPGLYEAPYTSKWGKKTVLRYHLQPILDPSGQTTGVQAIVEDISTARKLEEQLRQAQKMEAVGTLAGGVAHDFNNLLQAINGYAQLLLLDKRPGTPDYDELMGIHNAGLRAAQLVRQLLAFSRKMEGLHRPVDLNQSVIAAEKILRRTIPRMIEINVQLGPNLHTVNADPIQMEQVFMNLGSNAADAMPGGGLLTMTTQNVTLDEEFCRVNLGASPGEYVRLTITDNGAGMDSETIKHVFEPFFTTKGVGKGTGLGLASVYGIIKGHGGYIACRSQPGLGATFEIYLPAAQADGSQSTKSGSEKRAASGGDTILLVDDERYIRDLASQILKRSGYATVAADSGEKALEIFRSGPESIDLVIMDLGMPGMGGLKCTRKLLDLEPSLKIIIASGYGSEGQVEEALALGAAGYVSKPYQLKDLVSAVQTVLKQ